MFSVIHPDEYEKRIIRFLFDKVFIDSERTLNELFASSMISNNSSQNDIEKEQNNQNEFLNTPRESLEIIQILNNDSATVSYAYSNSNCKTTQILNLKP